MNNTIELIKQKAWQSRFFSIPEELAKVPTMLTHEECRMLSWIVEHHYKGIGQICDLGSFAGGSTVHLAYGLSKSSPGTGNKVHAFDRFRIAERHKEKFLYSKSIAHFEGEWALPVVKDLLGAYVQFVEFHVGDILEKDWTHGDIEVLFIDISESPELNDRVIRTFFPHLIPEQSIVIHQDYLFFQTPWIIATMELLADCFELIGWTEQNSAIFLCKKAINPSDVSAAMSERLTPALTTDLMKRAMRKFPFIRQKEALAEAILAAEEQPNVTRAWEFRRPNLTQEGCDKLLSIEVVRSKISNNHTVVAGSTVALPRLPQNFANKDRDHRFGQQFSFRRATEISQRLKTIASNNGCKL